MGEVYRAKDLALRRVVVLKTLPMETASDPLSRARLEREARSASALNHPNIVTIHEIGSAEGLLYVAMEFVEGRTLREAIASGPFSVRALLDVAAQMADGIARAHAAGIVHRDLKPDNVMLTGDGRVKILDFGLAKAVPVAETIEDQDTVSRLTEVGTVLGTVGYMSPEQATGKPVDFRSDQFSLGAILYELATGQRAFQGATTGETLVAIVRDEPRDMQGLLPGAPPQLRWIIERLLSKAPEQRFGATIDLARDLAKLRDHLAESLPTVAVPDGRAKRRSPMVAPLVVVGVLALGTIAALAGRVLWTAPLRTDQAAPYFKRLTFERGALSAARFLPGGDDVLYSAAWRGNASQVFRVGRDTLDSTSLGLPPARLLSVSPRSEVAVAVDDEIVGGWESAGTLGTAPLGSTGVRERVERVEAADWGPDGERMAIVRDKGTHRVLEFPVGTARFQTTGWVTGLRVSPDGQRVAFFDAPYRGDVSAGRLLVIGGEGSPAVLGNYVARTLAWTPDGKEIWFSMRGVVTAVALDGTTRNVYALPGRLHLHDIDRRGRVLISAFTGRREMMGQSNGTRDLTWFDFSHPTDISFDGRRVAFEEQNLAAKHDNYAIFMRGMDGSAAVKLGEGRLPTFSPDGRSVATAVRTEHGTQIDILPVGAGERRTLPRSTVLPDWLAWFPDGRRLLVVGHEAGRPSRLYVQDLDGTPRPISEEGVAVSYAKPISPDGRTILAFGERSIHLIAADGSSDTAVPGTSPGDQPFQWTPDGRGIFVQRGLRLPARIETVDIATGSRSLWKELRLDDAVGVLGVDNVFISADARSLVYTYARMQHDLYIVEGLE